MEYPDFNPDPDIEAEAERYAADFARREAEYADFIADVLDITRYDDPFDTPPPWDEPEDESWRDEPETEW